LVVVVVGGANGFIYETRRDETTADGYVLFVCNCTMFVCSA
jgi:hypothetical protein